MQCNERIDYWDFICEYLPNYEKRDDVLMSDILFRFVTGEQVDDNDVKCLKEKYHTKENALEALKVLDKKLFSEALDRYLYEMTYVNINSPNFY